MARYCFLSVPSIFTFILFFTASRSSVSKIKDDLLVMTVATDATDGFLWFMRSINKYKLDIQVIGMGEEWRGGDITIYPGGGFKVNLLKEALKPYKDRDDLLVVFSDSYDVVFTNNAKEIKQVFKKLDAKVIFSAEGFCWPDTSLATKYPEVKTHEKKYLNSGGFMGYASQLYEIVTSSEIKDQDDDQLFYTKIYLDPVMREKWGIKLDSRNEIFQSLNGALDEVNLKFKGSHSFMYNIKTGSVPIIVHGNGPIKPEFNRIANYLADAWTPTHGCQSCDENTISLKDVKDEDHPRVFMALFIEHATPFITEWFQRLVDQNYPKKKIDLYIHNRIDYHQKDVEEFLKKHGDEYKTVDYVPPQKALNMWHCRNHATHLCGKHDCQYYFAVDSDAQLTNSDTLVSLIEQNRSVIAPMLSRSGKLWSNFWGALNKDGFYARAEDYLDLLNENKRGLWNVPFIRDCILIQGRTLELLIDGYTNGDLDPDMGLCKTIRNKGMFMHVSNMKKFGRLINSDNFEIRNLHNELSQIFDNRLDWEERYIHENYSKVLDPESPVDMPCQDVYLFPILSNTFCRHLIEEMEHFGKWSNGQNQDSRISGGYENVPTQDIHMKQVGLENAWLHFLKEYIVPIQLKLFPGYYSKANSLMNFVVRYRPDEQPALRPHHDSSTFTINIALNEHGVDYQGGGCRFLRYNCSITASKVGYVTMHPGRLTHYHEGLRTTQGTRYIMISFIDP